MGDDSLINSIYQRLVAKATEDGTISNDESSILNAFKMEANNYDNYLNKATEDGIITDDERKKLTEYRSKLMEVTFEAADSDDKITDEEKDLLNLMVRMLKEMGPLNF